MQVPGGGFAHKAVLNGLKFVDVTLSCVGKHHAGVGND